MGCTSCGTSSPVRIQRAAAHSVTRIATKQPIPLRPRQKQVTTTPKPANDLDKHRV